MVVKPYNRAKCRKVYWRVEAEELKLIDTSTSTVCCKCRGVGFDECDFEIHEQDLFDFLCYLEVKGLEDDSGG